jgi:Ca2+-binding RTX toxin-like protein
MAVDIAALQGLYGANTNHHDGNDAYTLPTANASGTFYESLWDTGGVDTIRAGATGRDAVIDLNDATLRAEVGGGGFVSYARGIHGGFTIANGVLIEDATGCRGDDGLIGNEARNVLTGGDGDDRLTGGFGADRLTAGSAGRDTFIFEAVRESSEGEGIERITDFDRSDEIDLRDIDWSGERGDQAFAFVTGPLTEAGEVHVRRAGGDTFIEAEVNGARDADLVVRLDGLVTLREVDVML